MIISINRYEIENYLKNLLTNPSTFTNKKFKFFLIDEKRKRNMIISFYNYNKKKSIVDFLLIYHYGTEYKNFKKIPVIKINEMKKFLRVFLKRKNIKKKQNVNIFCYSINFKKFYKITQLKNNIIIENQLLNIFTKFKIFFHLNLIYDEKQKVFYFFTTHSKKIMQKIIILFLKLWFYSKKRQHTLLSAFTPVITISNIKSSDITIQIFKMLMMNCLLKSDSKFKIPYNDKIKKFNDYYNFLENKYSSGKYFYEYTSIWNVKENFKIGTLVKLKILYNNDKNFVFDDNCFYPKMITKFNFNSIINPLNQKVKIKNKEKKYFWVINVKFFIDFSKEIILFIKRNPNIILLFRNYYEFGIDYFINQTSKLNKFNIKFGFFNFIIRKGSDYLINLSKLKNLKYLFFDIKNIEIFYIKENLKSDLYMLNKICKKLDILMIFNVESKKNYVINLYQNKFINFFGTYFEQPSNLENNNNNNLNCVTIKNIIDKII